MKGIDNKMTKKEFQNFIENFIAGVDQEMNFTILAFKRILFTSEGVQRSELYRDEDIVPNDVKIELENSYARIMSMRNELVMAKLN